MAKTAITPTRAQDYPQWYQAVIKGADMAENAVVRGCMVIKPWGYSIWELIQKDLDRRIKETGHENFYFPLFVPLSFLAKEAEHVEGFAKECAVVTHHRLVMDPVKGLIPGGELEEPLVVRPTSEAVIGEAYSRWINSYRDLPMLGNQWANIVRWEMRPRIFLRTSEFLWQEGHTAHETAEEAIVETEKMLAVYADLSESILAVPVVQGKKTASERFPGAVDTYTIESMMQDKKALQAGTSHFLGQNFAKAFNIDYLSREGTQEHVWTTSWGVTTRLIGGVIMTHSDDDGLVLPPRIAPYQVVIVPVMRKDTDEAAVHDYCNALKQALEAVSFAGEKIRVHVDTKDRRTGDKIWGWIKKGVPVRVEVGQREFDDKTVCVSRRDQESSVKTLVPVADFSREIAKQLGDIQAALFQRAQDFQVENTFRAETVAAFDAFFAPKAEKTGFVLAYWNGDAETEARLKTVQVTARCIPLKTLDEKGVCLFTGTPNAPLTLFAKSY